MSSTFQGIRGEANGLAALDSSALIPVAQLPVVTVAKGGTNSSTALNNSSVMVSSAGAIVELGQATNGQLVVGNTGGAPVLAALTGTTNQVVVTNGAGTITLSLPQNINTTATPTFNQATITNAPAAPTDATNKAYVDSAAQGLDVKAAAIVATTVDIDVITGGILVVDGVTTATGDRVVVKNQTLPQQNGIYVADDAGPWVRSADADTWDDLVGAYVFVDEGLTQAKSGWFCNVVVGGTLGVTPVTWVQFSSEGTYTAGAGLTLTGAVFSLNVATATTLGGVIVPTAGGLVVDGSGNISVPTATSATLGISSPDNTTIKAVGGVYTAQTATTSSLGVVQPDGTTIAVAAGVISVPTATTTTLGVVKADGTSVLVSGGGVLSVPTGTSAVLGLLSVGSNITVAAGSISLPQSVATSATPEFASVSLSSNTNQLTLGTTNLLTITMAALSANRTVTFPNANSNTVVPANAPTNQFVTGVSSAGVIAFAQPSMNSISVAVAAKAANYGMVSTDNKIVLTSNGLTVRLPPIASVPTGQEYLVQLYNVATGTVTPDTGDTGVTLNGLASFTLAPNYGSVLVYTPDNLQWLVA